MGRKPAKVEGVYERVPNEGIWSARYRKDGKVVRKSFGRDRDAAVAFIEKARTIKRTGEGTVPSSARLPVRTFSEMAIAQDGVLLGDLCDGLLRQIQGNPEQYRDQHNPPIRIGRIKKAFGNRPAASIRPFEIGDWISSMDLAPATRNRYKTVFSSIYVYGKQRDKISVNPAREVKQSKIPGGVIRYLDPAEEVRLRKVLQSDVDACGPQNERLRNRKLHHIYELDIALGTGMRRGEQYGLTWDDVNFERREIHLSQTKNGTGRVVHMIDDVIAALKGLKVIPMVRKNRSADRPNDAPENSVFSLDHNEKWFKDALKRAKIKNFRWHDLRHTFCSRLAQNGVSLKVIQEAAGHKTIAMSARYAHLDKSTLVNALSVLNRTGLR